jgi:predicted DNA-binding WGR domain protein
MRRNLIAHYAGGGSDKVYIACVRENSDGTFSVIGKWGRRGNINQQTVKATVHSEMSAEVEQRRLFNEKITKGYEDIDDASYSGPVTRANLTSVLEPEVNNSGLAPKVKKTPVTQYVPPLGDDLRRTPTPAAPKTLQQIEEEEGVMVCVNNAGMEDKFDIGVEYVVELHKKDETLIYAYDKFGKKGEYFKDRFVLPSVYQNNGNFKQFVAGEEVKVRIFKTMVDGKEQAKEIFYQQRVL